MILKSYNNITIKIKERYRCNTNIYKTLKVLFQNIVIIWLIHFNILLTAWFSIFYQIMRSPPICVYNVWKSC